MTTLLPNNYPEEYSTGKVHFFGRDFVVTPDVLIPRLETESLVRRARKNLASELRTIVVDIGCGSGIIGTSVADLADEIIFLDISPTALQIAEKNFRTHFPDKKAQFIVSDLLENLPERIQNPESRILFLTNLPYIKNEDWIHMSEDTVHEPRLALFGGEKTGFELYERLFKQLSALPLSLLGEGLGVRRCIFEFGFDQREVAESIVKQYPNWNYEFFADYAGIERFGEILFSFSEK